MTDKVADDELQKIVAEWHASHRMPRMAAELIALRAENDELKQALALLNEAIAQRRAALTEYLEALRRPK